MLSYKAYQFLYEAYTKFGRSMIPRDELLKIGLRVGYTKNATVFLIHKLTRGGYLENPLRGGYRLTEKAIETIHQMSGENEEEHQSKPR